MRYIIKSVILTLFVANFVFAQMGPAIGADKKLIKSGQDMPDTFYIRKHIKVMEGKAFDGIVILPKVQFSGKFARANWVWFSKTPLKYENVKHIVDNLRAVKFRRFTDNFLWTGTHVDTALKFEDGSRKPMKCPGWFDRDFNIVVNNFALAAKICKQAGLKGILLDTEQYGGAPWDEWMEPFNFPYASAQKKLMPYSFAKCQKQVRLRGRQIMKAMCREYPDITVIVIGSTYREGYERIGRGVHYNPSLKGKGLASSDYGLEPAFIDGLLEGASAKASIVDGTEQAYPWNYNKRFVEGRKKFQESLKHCGVPEKLNQLSLGFGIMMDWRGWSQSKPYYANHFTPKELEYALYYALLNSDKYVWIWSQRAIIFPYSGDRNAKATVPFAYIRAIKNCKKPHPMKFKRSTRGALSEPLPPKASSLPDYSDKATFGPLEKEYGYVVDLPRKWKFIADEEDLGIGYYGNVDWDVSSWDTIEIGDYFENRGYRFNGNAWYRCSFVIPANLEGKRLFLHFGGIAGEPELYFNNHWLPPQKGLKGTVIGWEITKYAKCGGKNTVIVLYRNPSGPGGIYKNVKLAVKRRE